MRTKLFLVSVAFEAILLFRVAVNVALKAILWKYCFSRLRGDSFI